MFDAFLGPDLGDRTFFHGHSYSGNALAAAVALRHLELLDGWDVLATCARGPTSCAASSTTASRRTPSVHEVRLCGLMGGVELRPSDEPRFGRRVARGDGRARRAGAAAG